jgi:transposase-like protein
VSVKKRKYQQLGIEAHFDTQGVPDYAEEKRNPLNQQVLHAVRESGSAGASVKEIARKLGHTVKSIAGRCTELSDLGEIGARAKRDSSTVYVIIKRPQ